MKTKCEHCGEDYEVEELLTGEKVKCPKCGKNFVIKPEAAQPSSVTAGDWKQGQILLDDFLVERLLGEGGMGKVYLLKSRTTGTCFAVKRARGLNEGDRRNFLAELQTWIDLPEHPNLVPCRFFRTVGNEVLIFAEYVDGGSLKDWIKSRKLYNGGKAKALERILDTAIQFAWGLHCVNELDLVHQDVKPANVMMSENAQVAVQGLKARVTDYGLARARAAGGERYVPELDRSILVSSGGYTPAYCSPEQAAGRKVDRRTDLWSWGVSVMEMFQGDVTWPSGSVAAEALESFLEYNDEEEDIPSMPVEVGELLKGCFREDPAQRWESLEPVVQKLQAVYLAAIGAKYSRVLCEIEHKAATKTGVGERRTPDGGSWADPQKWLEKALRADGRDPSDATAIVLKQVASRRGQLVADMAAYDEARRVYERLVKGGRKDLETDLANLCQNAAYVHETVDDTSGALTLYDRAIEIYEQLVNVEGRRKLADKLSLLYMYKALVLRGLGDNRAAVALYDRASEIYERLINVEGRRELAKDLAGLYMNKANAIGDLGDNRAAVALFDRAIEIFERLVNVEERRELLATAYMNKANSVRAMGDNRTAVALYDRAIEIRERLVNVEGRRELANNLADLYQNKAVSVSDVGDHRGAVVFYDKAIEIMERLVNVEGRRELADGLAKVYMNKANAVGDLGDNWAAVVLFDLAIEIYERLVNVEGRRELANDLAGLYQNKANAVSDLGDNRAAVALFDRAIEISERLVNVEGRRELVGYLADLYQNKAISVRSMGDNEAALALYDRAIGIRERLVNVEGRRELADNLASLYLNKGNAVRAMGNNLAALALYDRAIGIRERLVNVEGRRELVGDLAWLKAYRGLALIRLGDRDRGKREAHEAITVLRAEVNRTGRADLKAVLDRAAKQLGEL